MPLAARAQNLQASRSMVAPVASLLHLPVSDPLQIEVVNVKEQSERSVSTCDQSAGRPRAEYGNEPRSTPHPEPGPDVTSLAERLRLLLAVPLETLLPGPDTVLDWPGNLHPYQLEGVRLLSQQDKVLLADDMGLGKTVQALAAIRILCIRRQIERILLVVPASLREQWKREIIGWAPELRTMVVQGAPGDRAWQWSADSHITIVSYETLRSDFTPNPQSPPRRRLWDLVVLDEAQKIKNRDSSIAHACKQLERRRSWALTGTPLENSLDDLASIMEFVDFVHGDDPLHYGATLAMLDRHRHLQLRRRKADVLQDLPPKQVVTLAIPLLPEQQRTYDRAEREGILELREHGIELKIRHVLELLLRLKQLCNFSPTTGESAKLDDIRGRMEILSSEGHRALIFSQFTDDIYGVGAICRGLADWLPVPFVGGMSSVERDRAVRQFKEHPRHQALVLSLRAGGIGLNLQEASYVFHMDRWWNPAIERQAEDRAHRMGQMYPVTVFKYVSLGTIEERIQDVLAQKQRLFDDIVDDVSLDLGSGLNRDELFGLFGLEPTGPKESSRVSRSTGLDLEDRTATLLRRLGWQVRETPRTRDGGVDLIATRFDEIGVEECLFVQCKDHARPVGVEVVRELLGVLPTNRLVRPVVVSPAGVTLDAARLAQERNVVIWDEERLSGLEM